MKITFLGGGNMASALIGGLLNDWFPAKEIAVIEIGAENRARLEKNLRVRCYGGPDVEALQCDALVLAVKPQQMREACTSLHKLLKGQLIISIAAGLRLTDLSRWLGGHDKLIRTMPNTPALISSGVTGMFAMPTVSAVSYTHLDVYKRQDDVPVAILIAMIDQRSQRGGFPGPGPADKDD